jgi:hypothetical protein
VPKLSKAVERQIKRWLRDYRDADGSVIPSPREMNDDASEIFTEIIERSCRAKDKEAK